MSARLHMIVADMADYLDPATLKTIVTYMADHLDHAALKTIILNAIPEHRAQEVYMGESTSRPGFPRSTSRGRAITIDSHEPAYIAEFPDNEALEYLDLIREVVSARNPPENAETRAFLLGEYATESTKTQGVPSDFQPILILFKKWCDLTTDDPDAMSVDPPNTPIVEHLIHNGFTEVLALQISKVLGLSSVKDIALVHQKDIDKHLQFLSPEERQLMWELARAAFNRMPKTEQLSLSDVWAKDGWSRNGLRSKCSSTQISTLLEKLKC
jgi:hypothetical protein